MREYEVTVIIKPDLEEDQRAKLIERVSEWLTPANGSVDQLIVEHWGQRRLAYPIRKFVDGYYVYFEATLDPAQVNSIERELLYVDDILRHLIVRKDS